MSDIEPVATATADTTLTDGAPLRMSLTENDIRRLEAFAAPLRAWTSPVFHGLDNIPADGPVLLVGNHNFLGIDTPVLWPELARTRGRLLRGLAENVLITVPGVRHLLQSIGCVRGNRENCRTLLEEGEMVLVFPGGGREAVRRKGGEVRPQMGGPHRFRADGDRDRRTDRAVGDDRRGRRLRHHLRR
ncbi:1-acyl-sn-glycerol-3-phosphate acyltransferase [Nocardia coffeae]|uniref:1-acyl-sn-glycerol-3-phosphate acyltransferase n=1 Tax=Nocardia coffeae TaxID=2873381 RepID=UPI001F48C5A5|nr:1-acyl-sn-glycerol-3-phosphate acyltransferase [Nocardia coffeae]